MATTKTLEELAASISKHAAIASEYLREHNLPTPSLLDGTALDTSSLPQAIQAACLAVQDASLELHELVQGPRAILMNFSTNAKADAATVFQFNLPQKVPLDSADEGITYAELAQQTGLAQSALETILRAAIVHRVFREPRQGRVAHSAASRLWATDPVVHDLMGLKILDNGLHVGFIAQALERHPRADEPTDSAAAVLHAALEGKGEAHEQRSTWFDILEREPARSGRARTAMNMMDRRDGVSLRHLVNGYDWASLPQDSLVIDLGGGHGDAMVAVASKFPHLRFMVQDLPQTIATAPKISHLPVEFLAHSFLDPQPTKGAKVYFFRWVFHNWPDKYGILILQTLIPALEKGSRVLLMDSVMPPVGGAPLARERDKRYMDLVMLANFNARDRPAEAYEDLFAKADKRFEFLDIKSIEGSELSLIEAEWTG